MKTLTPRQEKFAEAIAIGANQSDAYRMAYPVSMAWKAASVHNKASAMAKNGDVLARVEKLKEQTVALSIWRRQQSIEVLSEIALDQSMKPNDRITAVDKLNVMHGYNARDKEDSAANQLASKPTIDVTKLSSSALKEFLNAKIIY